MIWKTAEHKVWGPADEQEINKSLVRILISYGNYDDIITEELLEQLPGLAWIQLLSAGYDSLPLRTLAARNILVTTANGVHAKPISEYVLGIILHYYKNIPLHTNNKWKGLWDTCTESEELEGKTVGILGTGHIGIEIAKTCKIFGMNTLGLNSNGRGIAHFDKVLPPSGLDELLDASDIVCAVLPSTPDTVGLMNEARFRIMKDDALFINAGRGDLIVEEDLAAALKQGKFKGVALDVFKEEPLPPGHPFWQIERLIITPHASAKTARYMDRCTELFLKNLDLYQTGRRADMTNLIHIPALLQRTPTKER
ncbi:MAG: D-2-hydroxyacid dehydrogenase [Paenibacillus sp.]|uniref:D-2-hydroxyacid dehydrogenase n=1 Tax=Paenibacillus sp. TaxID=58172 RepID=UPI0029022BA6|nr:D-2-hydroxyacid dehydrogenase [Paenibacillus sp.]MDU2240862.1 D-2-hydroxyacid dehydrogenase [Paenibacillus sp.]